MTVQYLCDTRIRFSCLPRTQGRGASPSLDQAAESGSPLSAGRPPSNPPLRWAKRPTLQMARLDDFEGKHVFVTLGILRNYNEGKSLLIHYESGTVLSTEQAWLAFLTVI